MKRFATVLLCAWVLAGCATVRQYETLATPQGRTLRAGVGQAVFRITKTRDLPNIFGRADLWGERVDAGHQELRYLGMADEQRVIFSYQEVELRSNETTMSRRGIGLAPLSVSREEATPVAVQFRHDFVKQSEFEHSGLRIKIIGATPTELTYSLTETRP
jgi:hypothetical protein